MRRSALASQAHKHTTPAHAHINIHTFSLVRGNTQNVCINIRYELASEGVGQGDWWLLLCLVVSTDPPARALASFNLRKQRQPKVANNYGLRKR